MSIRIIAKGDRLFKNDGKTGNEVEIFGDEKSFYLKELGAIDRGAAWKFSKASLVLSSSAPRMS